MLTFAGLMPSDRVNAGKLDEWRSLPEPEFRRYFHKALSWWLSEYASMEIRARRSRIQSAGSTDEMISDENDEPRFADRDASAEAAFEAAELRMMLAGYPVLALKYLERFTLPQIAGKLGISLSTADRRLRTEKDRLRAEWER